MGLADNRGADAANSPYLASDSLEVVVPARDELPRPYPAVDPDVDLRDAREGAETTPREWDLLLAVSVGGVLGAEARYALSVVVPHDAAAFPWSTVVTNITGCLLIGVLLVVLLEVLTPHRLARPFLGTGILGGYTTYSTFAVDSVRLAVEHRPLVALAYVLTTVVVGAAAVWFGTAAMRLVVRASS